MILNSGSSLFSSGGQESITIDELSNLRCINSLIPINTIGDIDTPLVESNLKSVAKIEGSGVIYAICVYMLGTYNKTNLFGTKINIDNNTVIKKNVKDRNSDGVFGAGIICKDIFDIFYSDNFTGANKKIYSIFANKEDWPISYKQVDLYSLEDIDKYRYSRYFLIDSPLIFNNGFELFADHEREVVSNVSASCFCLYKINE